MPTDDENRMALLWILVRCADQADCRQNPAQIADRLEELARLIRAKFCVPTKESS